LILRLPEYAGVKAGADVIITMSKDVFLSISNGKMNAQQVRDPPPGVVQACPVVHATFWPRRSCGAS
jgi:hypothetical protein